MMMIIMIIMIIIIKKQIWFLEKLIRLIEKGY